MKTLTKAFLTGVSIAMLPVSVIRDISTMGGALSESGESQTKKNISLIGLILED